MSAAAFSAYAAASKAWFRSQRSPGRAEVAETALGSRRSRRSESDAFGPFWSSVIVWLLPAMIRPRVAGDLRQLKGNYVLAGAMMSLTFLEVEAPLT
jgi:hypothetical protein